MKRFISIGVVLCGVCVLASGAGAGGQVRRAPGSPADDKVGLAVALRAGGDSFQFNGQGTCTHAPKASIYDVPAQQWRVEQREGSRSVGLTFWRPAAGAPDMFNLHMSSGGKTYLASTTKGASGGSVQGSGSVTFAPAGKGGTFTIDATAANGIKISGTIKCEAFTAAIAEGGN